MFNYKNGYILVTGTITVAGAGASIEARANDRNNKKSILKNCEPFTDCVSKINTIQINNAEDLNVVLPLKNFIEYSDDYLKTSGSLYQFSKDKPNNTITNAELFKFK